LFSTVCSAPDGTVTENNAVGDVVTTIQKKPGVTLEFIDPPTDNPFLLQGDQIILVKSLDYEVQM
jgi:hypothetical protein